MATKSTLITNINNFITAIVTVLKVRNSFLEIINELFPTSNNYVTIVGDYQYDLTFTKSGNKCTLTGSITNTTGTIVGGVKLLDIPNSIYYPKTSVPTNGVKYLSGSNVSLLLADNTFILPNSIFLDGVLGTYDIISINTTYIVND